MLEPTRYKELCVDITTKRIKGGGYRVKGIAQHPVTGLCYEGIAPKYMTANSEAKIQETCRKVIYTLEQRYASTVLPPEKNALLSERVSAYLDTLLEKIDNAGVRIVPAWTAVGTNHSALVYFQNHVMDWLRPFLDGEKVYLPETDTAELKQLITEDSSASAKAVNDASVEKTVVRHLYDANCILSYLYRSGLGVPLITLVLDRSASVLPGNEMLKVVPADVFERFCGLLYEDSEEHPGQVLCAVIMVHGARTAEAAGTRLRDIAFRADHGNVSIFQQEKNGVRVQILKTDPSRRVMLIGEWGIEVIRRCEKHLEDDGTGEWCYTSAEELNEYVVTLLRRAGLTPSAIEALMTEMDLDAASNVSDRLSSYILRRNFAGLARNKMGFTLKELDAQLGHKGGIDMNQADVRDRVVRKLNRFRFSPSLCPDPWRSPVPIDGTESVALDQFNGYRLRNETLMPMTLSVNVTAREAGVVLEIGREDGSTLCLLRSSASADWSSTDRVVVGDLLGGNG